MERGDFPENEEFGNVVSKSINELINKPIDKKNQIEQLLDTFYIEYLPKGFIQYQNGNSEIDSIQNNKGNLQISGIIDYDDQYTYKII